MGRLARQAAMLGALLFAPAMVFAQGAEGTAQINGVVRDSSGAVMPGVLVEVTSPVLIEKVRTTVSGDDGLRIARTSFRRMRALEKSRSAATKAFWACSRSSARRANTSPTALRAGKGTFLEASRRISR